MTSFIPLTMCSTVCTNVSIHCLLNQISVHCILQLHTKCTVSFQVVCLCTLGSSSCSRLCLVYVSMPENRMHLFTLLGYQTNYNKILSLQCKIYIYAPDLHTHMHTNVSHLAHICWRTIGYISSTFIILASITYQFNLNWKSCWLLKGLPLHYLQ